MLHPRKDYARIQDPAGKIPMEEPVFLLRAQDPAAANAVRFWASENLDRGGDKELSRIACEFADKMDAWPVHKLADQPDVENIDHPEDEQPAEPETEQGTIRQIVHYNEGDGPEISCGDRKDSDATTPYIHLVTCEKCRDEVMKQGGRTEQPAGPESQKEDGSGLS